MNFPREFVPFPEERARAYRGLGLWKGETLGQFWGTCVERFGDRVAVIDGAAQVTYAELHERALCMARALARWGCQPGERIVLQMPNGVTLLAAFLGAAWAGVVPVLALPKHRSRELVSFAARARAEGVVQSAYGPSELSSLRLQLAQEAPSVRFLLSALELAEVQSDRRPGAKSPARATPDPGAVALLQLSGGSTGVQKLIPRTSDDYLYSVRRSAELCQLRSDTRLLAVLPLTHNFTLSSPGALGVLSVGGAIVTLRDPTPSVVLRAIVDQGIDVLPAVPALVRLWADTKLRQSPGERYANLLLQVGGAKLPTALASRLIDEWGCQLQQVFGMAEGLVCYTALDANRETRTKTQGRPMSPWDEVRIVAPDDPERRPLPPGTPGELWTRGPYTICGYWDDAAEQEAKFSRDGFYRTGDWVVQSTEGDLTVIGRLGTRINRGGEKVSPEELEAVLSAHPGVLEVLVHGAPDAAFGECAAARVVARPGHLAPTLSELKRHLRLAGLADFKTLDRLEVVSELEKTAVGKIDRSGQQRLTSLSGDAS